MRNAEAIAEKRWLRFISAGAQNKSKMNKQQGRI